jgi:hypothetical protein
VTFVRSDWYRLAQPGRLSVKEVPFSVLLVALAKSRFQGTLHARRGHMSKSVIFDAGVPVGCHTNLEHERLRGFIVQNSSATLADVDRAFVDSRERGVLAGEILVERGLITASALYRALNTCLARRVLDLFSWTDGELEVSQQVGDLRSALTIKVSRLVVTGVTRLSPADEVSRNLATLEQNRIRLPKRADAQLADIQLSTEQRATLDLFRTPKALTDLGESLNVETLRLVYALLLLGIMEVTRGDESSPSSIFPRSEPRVGGSVPIPAARLVDGVSAAPAYDREGLYKAYLSYRRKDPFELLDIEADASEHAIGRAFISYSRRFFPDQYADPRASDLREKACVLFFEGARAFALLSDPRLRAEAIDRRVRSKVTRERRPSIPPSAPVESGGFVDSAIHFERGLAHKRRNELFEAAHELELAAECDPQQGRYRAEAAQARYSATMSTLKDAAPEQALAAARCALDDLEAALRADPTCGVAALYAGNMARLCREWDRAEVLLRQASKLMAPDRRAINALCELAFERHND